MDSLIVLLFFVASVVLSLIYKKIASDYSILSIKNHRTLHSLPTPKGGGIVFSLLSILAVFLIWWNWQLAEGLLLALTIGGLIATVFGLADDIKNIKAQIKLIIQLFLGCWVLYCLYFGKLPLLELMPIYITTPTILLLMVWMMNAYNFIDGIDGLAASGAIFISITLALVLTLTGGPLEIIAIFILLASSVAGFIIFNWSPATIFMGDAGSIFLGYIFGVLLLFTALNNHISIWSWLTVFGYFFADTFLTQIIRVVTVKKWYLAHRSHAYQNLARLKNSHLKVTIGVILYSLIWVLPLTLLSALQPDIGVITTILSITPAMIVTYKYGPIFSPS
jgi:Fuc2NAc and GlcNAc transferase